MIAKEKVNQAVDNVIHMLKTEQISSFDHYGYENGQFVDRKFLIIVSEDEVRQRVIDYIEATCKEENQ